LNSQYHFRRREKEKGKDACGREKSRKKVAGREGNSHGGGPLTWVSGLAKRVGGRGNVLDRVKASRGKKGGGG